MSKFTLDVISPKSDGMAGSFNCFPPITTAITSSTFTYKPDFINKSSEIKPTFGTPSIFHFGNQKSEVDKSKTEFNFVFDPTTSNLNTNSSNCAVNNNLNSETLKLIIPSSGFDNESSNSKKILEMNLDKKLEEKTNSNFEIEDPNERNKKEINKQKFGINEEKEKDDEGITVKIFTEFRELINGFVKERVENEKRIMDLEKRVEALEKENMLKNVKESNSSATELNHNYIYGTIPTLTSSSNSPNFVFGTTVFPIMPYTILPHQVPPSTKMKSVAETNTASVVPESQKFTNLVVGNPIDKSKGLYNTLIKDAHSHEKKEHEIENSVQHQNKKDKEKSLDKSANLKKLFARLFEVISKSKKVWENEGNKTGDKEAS